MNKHILSITCDDAQNLVHKITGVISKYGLNIINNNEFVEKEAKKFFMRTKFSGEIKETDIIKNLKEILPNDAKIKLSKTKKKKIVILATKEHHCLGDLLIRDEYDEINAEIIAVVSNHEILKNLVDKFNHPFHYVPTKGLDREEHEEKVLEILDQYNPDYLVLAKYMRILTPHFVNKWRNKIINIHHSFLPAFIGANPYRQAFNRGVKMIGATSHFVNDNLDEGPIITQEVIKVNHEYTTDNMKQAGREAEKLALAKALKLVFEEKVFISGNKTIILD
ncbi:MAG: formyltetrahydrofolate deformylase [Fusobacteriota bacterium]